MVSRFLMTPLLAHPLCIVGDVHLARGKRAEVGRALAALARAHPGHELVLNGDSFDLSTDRPDAKAERSIAAILEDHAEARDALGEHGSVTFVAGNHDAAVASPAAGPILKSLSGDVQVSPWIVRRGPVHVEHGHLYDPDNAPAHPLANWTLDTEPLGVALTRHFVAPSGAFDFAHSDETTPLAGLMRTFSLYGLRAPKVVFDYYRTAIRLTARAGERRIFDERRAGAQAVAELAKTSGIDADVLRALALLGGTPTHASKARMFFRLYLDRSLATGALTLATLGLLAGGPAPIGVAAVAAGYLGFSVARGVNRYGGVLEERLRDAARSIRELSGAETVILGHTHRAAAEPGYLNPGSFAYPGPEGRGYVWVDRDGSAERRFFAG